MTAEPLLGRKGAPHCSRLGVHGTFIGAWCSLAVCLETGHGVMGQVGQA